MLVMCNNLGGDLLDLSVAIKLCNLVLVRSGCHARGVLAWLELDVPKSCLGTSSLSWNLYLPRRGVLGTCNGDRKETVSCSYAARRGSLMAIYIK